MPAKAKPPISQMTLYHLAMKPVLEASVPVTLEDVFTGSTKRIRVKRRGTDPPPTPDDPQRLRTGRPGVRPAAVLVLPKGLPAAPVRLEILTKCISMRF